MALGVDKEEWRDVSEKRNLHHATAFSPSKLISITDHLDPLEIAAVVLGSITQHAYHRICIYSQQYYNIQWHTD